MAWYKAGTCDVTNGSASIVGTGTLWVANTAAGHTFVGPDNSVYEVQSVNGDTSITLAKTYRGTTASAQGYCIAPTSDYLSVLAAQVAALISTYSGIATGAGAGKFGDGSAASPAITFAADLDSGFYRIAANTVGIAVNGVECMRISTGGVVTVGGASSYGSSSQVVVNAVANVGGVCVDQANGTTASGFASRSATVAGTGWYHFVGQHGNGSGPTTNSIIISGNGNVQNLNNSYGATSDERLKQDIVDAGSQWDDIKAMRVRKYRFKTEPTGPLQIGVIAQELEATSPGLVLESVQPGDDTPVKSVQYSVLYMKAVKCLQEAMARIEALEAKI